MNPEQTLIIGHKNPDTDAICSAIAHEAYLKATGNENVEAVCCGEIPERTNWVLEQADIAAPRLVTSVSPVAKDLITKKDFSVSVTDTIMTAYNLMVDANIKSMPVLDTEKKVAGLVKLVDLLQLMMPSQLSDIAAKTVVTSFKNTLSSLKGESVGAEITDSTEEEELILFVAASSISTIESRLDVGGDELKQKKVVVCGDRPNAHEAVIKGGVRAVVISGGFKMNEDLLSQAIEKGIIVIYSKYDTATTVQHIRCSRCVKTALTDDFSLVQEDEVIGDFRNSLSNSSQNIFPVVTSGDRFYIGSFVKSDMLNSPKQKLSLVDHNEFSQAVDGIEDARVVEVIDHHRLAGDVMTQDPIAYLNEPVGSTCTLVARNFKYQGLKPSRGVALCMLAGMISDTLNLTSPTTTQLDKDILQWLCEIASVDAAEFTKNFFEAGSLLTNGTAEDIVGMDRKEFNECGKFVSISQVEELFVDALPSRIDEIRATLQHLVDTKGYDVAIIAVTDISSHTSTILSAGSTDIVNALEYEQTEPGIWHAPGVVSRKKQIFPAMCQAISNVG